MNIIVVGAGIAGLSSAWALVKAGHSVTILEQASTIPNPLAASGDHHRIIRRAYGAASGYARLITEAYEAWDELWADLGENHLDARGLVCISREEGDEAERLRDGLAAGGYPFEMLEPQAAAERGRSLKPARSATRIFPLRAARCIAARSPPAWPNGCATTARISMKAAR